jgi:hypothetical protein
VNRSAAAGTRNASFARSISIDTVDVIPGFNSSSSFGTSITVV